LAYNKTRQLQNKLKTSQKSERISRLPFQSDRPALPTRKEKITEQTFLTKHIL